jgi:hypothetical protein
MKAALVIQASKLMKQIFILFLVVTATATIGCRSARKVQTVIFKKDTSKTTIIDRSTIDSSFFIKTIVTKIKENSIGHFNTFSAKIKIDYQDKGGHQPDLTVFARLKKDSIIWLSVNATIFSYEALRIVVTPDSVKVLNKKDKIIQLRSVAYLKELTQLPFDFTTLQDFLLGNPVFLDTNILAYKKEGTAILLISVGRFFKNLVRVNNVNYRIEQSKLDDVDPIRNRTAFIGYSNYETSPLGKPFATKRKIAVSEKSRLDIEMDYKQYSFNETLSFPFMIPKNYKRK